jgi:uncharacterized protein
MPIHIAITRQVRPGCEAEFQQALREFFQTSHAHPAVLGATMLTPSPGSGSREYGILRTFTNEKERDEFYASPMFQAWEERAGPLTDGGWSYHQLHGLEAWFRSPGGPPPRWKMALVTLLGVYPVSVGRTSAFTTASKAAADIEPVHRLGADRGLSHLVGHAAIGTLV